jgi:hypothetical protein
MLLGEFEGNVGTHLLAAGGGGLLTYGGIQGYRQYKLHKKRKRVAPGGEQTIVISEYVRKVPKKKKKEVLLNS